MKLELAVEAARLIGFRDELKKVQMGLLRIPLFISIKHSDHCDNPQLTNITSKELLFFFQGILSDGIREEISYLEQKIKDLDETFQPDMI